MKKISLLIICLFNVFCLGAKEGVLKLSEIKLKPLNTHRIEFKKGTKVLASKLLNNISNLTGVSVQALSKKMNNEELEIHKSGSSYFYKFLDDLTRSGGAQCSFVFDNPFKINLSYGRGEKTFANKHFFIRSRIGYTPKKNINNTVHIYHDFRELEIKKVAGKIYQGDYHWLFPTVYGKYNSNYLILSETLNDFDPKQKYYYEFEIEAEKRKAIALVFNLKENSTFKGNQFEVVTGKASKEQKPVIGSVQDYIPIVIKIDKLFTSDEIKVLEDLYAKESSKKKNISKKERNVELLLPKLKSVNFYSNHFVKERVPVYSMHHLSATQIMIKAYMPLKKLQDSQQQLCIILTMPLNKDLSKNKYIKKIVFKVY